MAPLPTAPGGLPVTCHPTFWATSPILLLGLEVFQCLLDPVREVLGRAVPGRVGVTLRSGGGESKPDRDECERRLHLCSFWKEPRRGI